MQSDFVYFIVMYQVNKNILTKKKVNKNTVWYKIYLKAISPGTYHFVKGTNKYF